MQITLIVSIALNVLLTGVLIYLHRTEDKRQEKKNRKKASDEIRRVIAAAAAYTPGPSSFLSNRFR